MADALPDLESMMLPTIANTNSLRVMNFGRSNENLHLAERTWHMSSKLTALTNKE